MQLHNIIRVLDRPWTTDKCKLKVGRNILTTLQINYPYTAASKAALHKEETKK